jgi:hypothetical protein
MSPVSQPTAAAAQRHFAAETAHMLALRNQLESGLRAVRVSLVHVEIDACRTRSARCSICTDEYLVALRRQPLAH